MDSPKVFKHSAELREYWRLEKRKQRARAKIAKEVKTEQNKKPGGNK